jgi:hypothetical protein
LPLLAVISGLKYSFLQILSAFCPIWERYLLNLLVRSQKYSAPQNNSRLGLVIPTETVVY